MKPIICFYCDGSEAKLAVITKEREEISVIKTASITTTSTVESQQRIQHAESDHWGTQCPRILRGQESRL